MAKKKKLSKLRISGRILRKKSRRSGSSARKQCRFSASPILAEAIDYKNVELLKLFLTERGKILPSRISGNSQRYQRLVSHQIKKARMMGLLPYCSARI